MKSDFNQFLVSVNVVHSLLKLKNGTLLAGRRENHQKTPIFPFPGGLLVTVGGGRAIHQRFRCVTGQVDAAAVLRSDCLRGGNGGRQTRRSAGVGRKLQLSGSFNRGRAFSSIIDVAFRDLCCVMFVDRIVYHAQGV